MNDNAPSGTPQSSLTAHRAPLHSLTGIRFLAATYIIVFHTQFALLARARNAGTFDRFINNGYLAVTLFFLLSGFILAYTYHGQIRTRTGHRRFWEARFARIWPMYAISLLCASAVHRSMPPLTLAIPTVLMLQAWNPFNLAMASAWNPVCWTLSVEALFYLLFPFIQTRLDRSAVHIQRIALALVILLCLVCNVSWRTLNYAPVNGLYRYIPYAVIHLPEFVAGVLLGDLLLRWKANHHRSLLLGSGWWTWLSAALSLALLCLRIPSFTSLVVPAFGALLFGLAAEPSLLRRLLSTRALLLGGQISYSMYLLHLPLKDLCSPLFDRLQMHSPVVRFGAEFAAILLLSLLAFHLIEDPARGILRKTFLRLEQRRSTTESAQQ